MTNIIECLVCGMQAPRNLVYCPKCDAELLAQSSGQVLEIDVAHSAETIAIALAKLERAIEEAQQLRAQGLRVIVGRGQIRDEVLRQLAWLQHSNKLLSYDYDGGNTGAIIATLRR